MNDLVIQLEEEKARLTEKLSDIYSRSLVNIDEYERLLDYINKIETKREVVLVENMLQGYNSTYVGESAKIGEPANSSYANEEPDDRDRSVLYGLGRYDNAAVFSNRTIHMEPVNGKGGNFISIFGSNKIIVGSLPPGRTVMKIESVFGSTEIVVARNVVVKNKADAVFSNINCPEESYSAHNVPELVIKGEFIFSNLTVRRK